jgi:hypothetical protein
MAAYTTQGNKMTIAQELKKEYSKRMGYDLDDLLKQARIWGVRDAVMPYKGSKEWPTYRFEDNSAIEFELSSGWAKKATVQ